MTQKAGKGKQGGGKVIAQSHNVAKGGFQKSKAGAMQSKQAFIGKKDVKPIGKAGPQGGKGQKPAGKIAIGGKGMNAKKGKIEEDDDDEDEDDEDDFDGESMDDEEMDDDDIDDEDDDDDDDDEDDEELSDDEENDVKPNKDAKGKAALTPKSILKNGSTPKSAADEKAPKLVTAANGATPKGNQAQAKAQNQKAAADTKAAPAVAKVQAKERPRTASGSDDAFKLIANTEAEALTATLRSDFDTRVKRIAGNTVFVKGLHRRCSEDDLRRLAKDVLTIRLPLHENKGAKAGAGGRIRGYAFLEFKDEATARRNAEFLKKDAQLVNSEGQACKLEASISSAGGYVMTADDWNVGSLYVSNLPNSVTENDVLALFDRNDVVTVVLPRNRTTGVPRGVAHVRFRSAEASIRQFDAARAKVLRGEFSIKGHSLSIAFSSRKTLKREREEQGSGAKAAKPAATNSQTKIAEVKPVTPSQTPKQAAGQKNTGSAAKATPTTANQKGNVAANKSLNESVTVKNAANLSLTKKPETPASAQKGPIKRKLDEEEAKRKAKVAKRDEEEDDDDDDEEDDDDDEDDDEDDE